MLKKIIVGNREIPVPVPLRNLSDALSWIEDTFVKKDSILTKILLDDVDMLDSSDKQLEQITLMDSSRLEVEIESPWELSIRTLDAIRDLAHAMEKRLKLIAVECWEQKTDSSLKQVKDTANDLNLMINLVSHINGIMDYTQKEMAPINGLTRLIARPLKELEASIKKSQWKKCSHILLNRIEYLLKELVLESESLQISILSTNKEPLLSPQLEIG